MEMSDIEINAKSDLEYLNQIGEILKETRLDLDLTQNIVAEGPVQIMAIEDQFKTINRLQNPELWDEEYLEKVKVDFTYASNNLEGK